MSQTHQLYCHHCSQWVGESSDPVTLVGMVRDPRDRNLVPSPRNTWRCKSCGWVNIFRVVAVPAPHVPDWRTVELKQRTG